MSVRVETAPASELLTVAEAKLRCKIETDITVDDGIIAEMIAAAREELEHILGRSLPVQTLQLVLDEFPVGAIELPRPPVQTIIGVEYIDADGAGQTLSGSLYSLENVRDVGSHWLLPAYDADWPATRDQANAVTITYRTGYSSAPPVIKQAIAARVGTLYRYRSDAGEKPPVTFEFANRALDRYRLWG